MLELSKRILKKKYIIILLAVSFAFGIIAQAYNMLILDRQKSMVIEFNYPGAENGLNPDGSVFEISDLKSDEVIEKAKENLKNKDIDTDFLQSRIFITSKITDSSLDKIVSAVQNEKNSVYLPTTFYVYYSQKNKFSKNESVEFMQNLADAYTEYFDEKYSEKNDILIYDENTYDFADTDYHEIYEIFSNKVDSMLKYIKTHQDENRAFFSQDKVNLGMAAKKLESFRDVSLEKFYAFIVQNSVSKDNREYTKRVDYLIESHTLEYNKSQNASDIAKGALDKYDPRITAVAFVPSIDAKHNYYMSRTKTGIDDLTKQSYNDGMSASAKLKDIEDYKNLHSKFSAVESTTDDMKKQADEMIKNLSSELSEISETIHQTDNEYLEHKTMNYFKIRLPQDKYSINLTMMIKFMVLGFILTALGIILLEMFKDKLLSKFIILKDATTAIKIISEKRGE